jgi:hypothetical protein
VVMILLLVTIKTCRKRQLPGTSQSVVVIFVLRLFLPENKLSIPSTMLERLKLMAVWVAQLALQVAVQHSVIPYQCDQRLLEVRFRRHLCPEKRIVTLVGRPHLAMAIDLEDINLASSLSTRLYHSIKAPNDTPKSMSPIKHLSASVSTISIIS